MTDVTEGELERAWRPRSGPPKYEYLIDGVADFKWTPSDRTSPKWLAAIDAAFDLLTVTEVAFTVGDPADSTVVIRYRKAQS
jgi:hypothetical protein